MGTKRKHEEEILEIHSDDDEDSDVQIQERPIPVVTVDDDDETAKQSETTAIAAEHSSSQTDVKPNITVPSTPPPPPNITEQTVGSSKETLPSVPDEQPCPEKVDESLLLSMKFRDQELFQLFKGSLTEYLKTTFQLKLAGQEVDVLHLAESASIQVLKKKQSSLPEECAMPTPKKATAEKEEEKDNGMFVIDSTPAKTAKGGPIIPSYKKAFQKVLDNTPTAEPEGAKKKPKPKQLCWNCDGDHGLRDCTEPRNFAKISKMKQEFMKRTDRYHVDLEQKYGHIVPGRLTTELRQALGLGKRDLPMHIYKMRMFGYPPGWLEDAKITHSGLQLFDSNGSRVQDSDESEGEVDNIKLKYDVRKIINFPGFNVPAGDGFYDDSKFFGAPPRLEHQSREEMIRNLEGTLVQGYRRKKLRMASSAQPGSEHESADMDLDNPDESFLTLDSVGECDKLEGEMVSQSSSLPSINGAAEAPPKVVDEEPEDGEVNEDEELTALQDTDNLQKSTESNGNNESAQDDSVILVEEEVDVICLDDTRKSSPSLEDLRRKHQELLKQLEDQSPCVQNLDMTNEDSLMEDVLMAERLAEEQEENNPSPPPPPPGISQTLPAPLPFAMPAFIPGHCMFPVPLIAPLPVAPPPPPSEESAERPPEPEFLNLDEIKMTKTPFIDDPASMGLKKMSLGTPILTAFSPFNSLPCGDAFSKGVSDVINFENLPNSTGKYERMKSLLSKVRNVISAHNGVPENESR